MFNRSLFLYTLHKIYMRLLHLAKNEAAYILLYKGYTKQLYVHAMNNIPGHGHAHAEQTTDVLRILHISHLIYIR